MLKCIGKRSKLLGLERRKSELPFASRKNETFAERKATAGETFAERKATIDDSLAQQGGYEEGSAIENCAVTLHAMCCVTEIAVTWTAGWPSHNEGMEICGTETRDQSESQATNHALRCAQGRATLGKNDAALQSMHCVIAMAGWASYNEGLEIRGTETRDQSESQATNHALRGAQGRATLGKNDAALQSMHCVIGAAIPVRLASLGAPYKARRALQRLSDPHRQAAVDGEGLAGEVVVGHDFGDQCGNLFGRPFPVQWNPLVQILLLLFRRHVVVETRADDARGNAVDADVVVGHFAHSALANCGKAPFTT